VSGGFRSVAALAERAAAHPTELAIVVDGGRDLTFADWERRSVALAAGLAHRGVGAGDRVALRFDAGQWADFAVAYVGLRRAGATAVLLPSGLAAADARRIVRHCGATVALCAQHLGDLPATVWVTSPDELERSGGAPRLPVMPAAAAGPAELVYPIAPLSRPRPLARGDGDFVGPAALHRPGWLVHTWPPGSLAAQHALAHVLLGPGAGAATVARFDLAALCALTDRLGATTCGLTSGVASVLAAAPGGFRLASVEAVVVSAAPGAGPPTRLAASFGPAAVLALDDLAVAPGPATASTGPVGASQLGMLWHEQLAPGSFNLPALVRRYRGRLDVAAFGRALGELVRRHEPLRTTFDVAAGAPSQDVHPAEPFQLPVVDLAELAPADRDARAARVIAEASGDPFDLADGPVFAPCLLRLGVDDHVLVVRLHHTAFDDWSVDVFRRDLSSVYSAFAAGEPSPLPEPTTRFVDVCRRQQARLAGGVGDEQRASWRATMAGAPFPVQLPLGVPTDDGPGRPGAGEPVRHDLTDDLARQVRALAPRLRATPFMTVLAAFEVLLARRTGQDDLVIASVIAGRGATAIESMIGCFTKKVLLRLRLDGDPTFAEVVARTRGTVLRALAHQELAFEAVVQDTLGRAAARHGLVAQVPVVFQGETPQQARLVLPGLEVGPYEVAASARRERHFSGAGQVTGGDHRPRWGDGAYCGSFLLLSLLESGPGLALVARGVFSPPAARGLLEELEAVLADIVAAPDRRLSDLVARGAPVGAGDELVLRGLRLNRSRLEAALSTCPGVAEAAVSIADHGGDPRLVAHLVADGDPPTLAQLRQALWAALPGSAWPAEVLLVDTLPRGPDGRLDPTRLPASPRAAPATPDPAAALLSSIWAGGAGFPPTPSSSYWQDFSFLPALGEARAAGLPLTDVQVGRCRTPEMLAAALAAAAQSSG